MELEDKLKSLMKCICQTNEEEISPEVWDLQMERVAEMAANGENIETVLPAITQYLQNSPDCSAEFEALVAMLKSEKANSE